MCTDSPAGSEPHIPDTRAGRMIAEAKARSLDGMTRKTVAVEIGELGLGHVRANRPDKQESTDVKAAGEGRAVSRDEQLRIRKEQRCQGGPPPYLGLVILLYKLTGRGDAGVAPTGLTRSTASTARPLAGLIVRVKVNRQILVGAFSTVLRR